MGLLKNKTQGMHAMTPVGLASEHRDLVHAFPTLRLMICPLVETRFRIKAGWKNFNCHLFRPVHGVAKSGLVTA